jgi:methanogenic corrinoid protein MtbC1
MCYAVTSLMGELPREESMSKELTDAIVGMREDEAVALVTAKLNDGVEPAEVLEEAQEAMVVLGERFEREEVFIPELIMGGEIMKHVSDLVKPHLTGDPAAGNRATIVLGTVAGDIHDIGKDVVGFMLDVNAFDVQDLGVDVPAEMFVQKVRELKPAVVGLSGFLTQAFDQMKRTVAAIQEAGLRESVKIMIGGAIMDASVAQYVGADAYGADATAAVRLAKGWVA